MKLLQYIGRGHYRVSDKTAGDLARKNGGKLPRPGYELNITLPGGEKAALLRTPFRSAPRGWVWAVLSLNDLSRYQDESSGKKGRCSLRNGGPLSEKIPPLSDWSKDSRGTLVWYHPMLGWRFAIVRWSDKRADGSVSLAPNGNEYATLRYVGGSIDGKRMDTSWSFPARTPGDAYEWMKHWYSEIKPAQLVLAEKNGRLRVRRGASR